MLPQTIFFKSKDNEKRTAECYNSMKHMLFLARDRISFGMAKQMFPDIPVMQFPDIVTTLIGNYSFNYSRDGIMFCCRDDGEKYYSDEEISLLMNKCRKTLQGCEDGYNKGRQNCRYSQKCRTLYNERNRHICPL